MKHNISNSGASRGLTAKRSVSAAVCQMLCIGLIAFSAISCSLDTDNEKMAPATQRLEKYSDLQATSANLYLEPWYEFHKRMLILGDARANNLLQNTTDYNEYNAQGTFNEAMALQTIQRPWASLYNVITQADYVIEYYAPYCIENNVCTQKQAEVVIGEARMIRAMAYYYLAIYWHNVPIVDNPATVSAQAYSNRFEDVMLYAIRDAEYAANHMQQPYAVGRVARVPALTLLSRLYITIGAYAHGGHTTGATTAAQFYAKADSVATLAIAEAESDGYGLMEDYEQIFRVQNNNCREVLFALQFVSQSMTRGLANDIGANMSYRYCIVNRYGKAWNTRAGYDFVNLSSIRGGMSRTRGNIFLPGTTYDYLYHEMENTADKIDCCDEDAHNHTKGKVWTVERKLDMLPVKKQVVGGPIATSGLATNGNSGFCTPMLRLAEAYLNQSEARLMLKTDGADCTDATVLEGINTIRRRAYKMERERGEYGPGLIYHDYTTVNLDSLLQERRLEFFCEGTSWGDIVRMSFISDAQLKRMIDYNNNRLVDFTSDPVAGCNRQYKYQYTRPDDADIDHKVGTVATANIGSVGSPCYRASRECTKENLWAMIYPPTEISYNPNLKKDPVPYDFGE